MITTDETKSFENRSGSLSLNLAKFNFRWFIWFGHTKKPQLLLRLFGERILWILFSSCTSNTLPNNEITKLKCIYQRITGSILWYPISVVCISVVAQIFTEFPFHFCCCWQQPKWKKSEPHRHAQYYPVHYANATHKIWIANIMYVVRSHSHLSPTPTGSIRSTSIHQYVMHYLNVVPTSCSAVHKAKLDDEKKTHSKLM